MACLKKKKKKKKSSKFYLLNAGIDQSEHIT